MLGKLLKYEFKATGRVLLPMYGAMIVFALITALMLKTSMNMATTIAILIFTGICVGSVVLTIVITIQRFQKNLLTDEGYLMFTLPLSSSSLIWSKLIVAVLWGVVGTLVGILCGSIFAVINIPWGEITYFFHVLGILFAKITGNDVFAFIISIITAFLSYIIFVLVIYFSLAFGQLPIAGKHRNAMSLLAFFGVYILYSIFAGIFGTIMEETHLATNMIAALSSAMILEAIVAVILFFCTNFILKKHLNLE